MKAIIYHQYGSPDVLKLEEVEKPTPKDNEVLIKVHAASINPLDWHFMRGTPYFARLSFGLLKPKNPVLGADVSGVVEEVGKNVRNFLPGDKVYGDVYPVLGSLAEYACTEEKNIVLKPANASFEEAAAVPVAAVTALQSIRDSGNIQSGQTVMINGAAGGVGTFAVQIAKSFGAEVTGVCSTRNLDLVRSLGADHVIDYTVEDFTQSGKTYDLIIDNVGNRTVSDHKRALKPNGKCIIVGFTSMSMLMQHAILGPLQSLTNQKKVLLMGTAQMKQKDLTFLKELMESGKVKPSIDRSYPLSETAEAIRYLETGHARGKVVVTMD